MSTAESKNKDSSPCVVVLGSLHYDIMVEAPDRPVKGETVTGTCWYPKFGGKGGNQAVAARLHGSNVRLVSATGDDNFADYIDAKLAQADISNEYIARLENEATGMSVAIQDAEGDYGAVIVSGANLAIEARILEDAAIWSDAAMLLLQNEIPESLNLVAATKARELGVPVSLNAAPARTMSQEFLSLVDILVVNAIEAQALGSAVVDSLDTAAHAAEFLSDRFSTVIVTAGADGVAACSVDTGVVKIAARQIEVSSTHGAGDTFTGVLCAELASGTALSEALGVANDRAAKHVATG